MNIAITKNSMSFDLANCLEVWMLRGLRHFWQSALPTDHAAFQMMETRIKFLTGTDPIEGWDDNWPFDIARQDLQNNPLIKLINNYSLTPKTFFIVTVCGNLEASHLTNLVIAELQAPDRSARLSVHLAIALVENLFLPPKNHSASTQQITTFNALDLATHPLITQDVLHLQGNDTLPLKKIAINPWLWSILIDGKSYWPGINVLRHNSNEIKNILSAQLKSELLLLANLLKDNTTNCGGIVLRGNPYSGRGICAQFFAEALGLTAIEIPIDLWLSQPILKQACYYAGWMPVLRLQSLPTQSLQLNKPDAGSSLYRSFVPVAIITSQDLSLQEGQLVELNLDVPPLKSRQEIWETEIGDLEISQQLASAARLSAQSIHTIATSARQIAAQLEQPIQLKHIAQARARMGADKLRLLAQPIERQVDEKALVIPALVKESLNLLLQRAYQRESLWKGLGSTLSVTPNPGVRALFVGESGTGKTLAASYIATCLAAPLYRVDLSAVMNKYIGESEKNLAQLLDHAAASDVVLLFDEADALFGNRGDGQETGERFANMLTNFLLTRIESHPGIVILTTNSRERIDNAFTRRLDLIVEFPMPDFEERLHLWRSHLGDRGPGEEIYRNLASYCDLAGGQVRNVVLTAATFSNNHTINSANLYEGLKVEYRKQGREIPKKLEVLASIHVQS
jgi:ATPase family associated with various cellular activities (AAA)